MSFRNWCFTSFCVDAGWQFMEPDERVQYYIYQIEECPETGKLHLQGYVEFTKPTRRKMVKRLFDDDSMHLEKRLGTAKQAIDYCRKEESRVDGPWEYGEHKGQGKRTDIDDCVSAITDGASWKEIIEECPSTFVRYHKGLEKVKFIMTESPKWRDVEVFVYWGKPGTGKSRKVFENEEDENYICKGMLSLLNLRGGRW